MYKGLIVPFFLGILFMSCSDDNSTENNNSSEGVEIPAVLLGTYTGLLEATDVANESGTVTLVESSSRIYTVNFSDNVASISDIIFSDIGNGNSFIFTDSDRGVIVSCGFTDTETILSVIQNDPVIAFGGAK